MCWASMYSSGSFATRGRSGGPTRTRSPSSSSTVTYSSCEEGNVALLMVYADAVPTDIASALDVTGHQWKAVASVEAAERLAPDDGWLGALILVRDFERAIDFCRT